MSQKFPGGFITKSPVAPTTSAASGIWTLDQQEQYQQAGTWPQQPPPPYIEDVFSTYLYTGNGSTQTITNGIDLAGKGGLVWGKSRSVSADNVLVDSVRGIANTLVSNSTGAQNAIATAAIGSFNSNGFSFSGNSDINANPNTYASWTFRKQAKFFDVVTWSGNGTIGRTISHSLGSVPGCIIVKKTNSSGASDWVVYHRSLGATKAMILNLTDSVYTWSVWNDTAPTSTVFSLNDASEVNGVGNTYVAYLFAHDAGGFGATETDNVISCGSYVGTSANFVDVNLGYEPQWFMVKKADATGPWYIIDNMRDMSYSGTSNLQANASNAEQATVPQVIPSATGISLGYSGGGSSYNTNGVTYIYIAIRRGPMKVPTSGTSVFSPVAYTGNGSTRTYSVGFPTDISINMNRNGAGDSPTWNDRLRGSGIDLYSNITSAEANNGSAGVQFDNQTNIVVPSYRITNATPYIDWCMRRAPSFFDEVCYTGNGSSNNAKTHNLGVAPELLIIKNRSSSASGDWYTFHTFTSSNFKKQLLDTTDAQTNYTYGSFLDAQPTSTTFTVNSGAGCNESSVTYVAYLFATCPGVSKVGSYTGNGSSQTINCGFTSGARFILIKKSDPGPTATTTGNWIVFDSARGISATADPALALNSTAAEVTSLDLVDPQSVGFQVNGVGGGLYDPNENGATYIYLAIS